ncbi:Scar1 [Heterostelium album PN500]|uniref:Scar1 n=1 Tax=Heterostelium pallidum (strain ATCC 26659 / Pp 5 / PN500) TaxID=670386 RepID=D3BTZ9_HETP5|nr:Scar1 [Heterostelium album PN500]EFA75185.1 Scar1 [Heterostelium album PN500]|eukprot:XP_020427319.1 Scar1 [Heterostelium album PN500]
MVLITRYLPSTIENNRPSLEGVQSKEQIVDAVLHNTTVGLINQLMVLADHANSIFSGLAAETSQVTARLNKLNGRLDPLIQMVNQVESYHQRTSIDTMNSRPRAEYHAENPEKSQLFTHASVPQSVTLVYNEKCYPPPSLHLLDPYMDEGQHSLKLYTNPDFFIDEWIAEMQKQREEARQRRRERKEARLRKKGEKGDAQAEVKKVKRLHKVRYDPVTGEKILIPVDGAPSPAAPSTSLASPSTPPTPVSHSFPPPPPINNNSYPSPPPIGLSSSVPPPPINNNYRVPPPPIGVSTPPPAMPSHRPQSVYGQPQPPGNIPTSYAPAPAPPPPPPVNTNAPAPPPPPPMAAKSGLAAALEGASLRPAETKPKAADARSDLLSSIVAGMSLKPAEERKIPEAQQQVKTEAVSVADILARRIAWAPSDSEDDDDSDDDSDWD